ncbi:SDR family NAD(P)-dependent oxidoreductase [Microbacterium oryzae]|uniref:SDR family NAD(P)-dependent oxidoreductase n=1 Tax=Microbacterium oryzae TaxID=743009 RepID=UPI0025AF0B0C|nr:SDR family NAD(P)-dependent oxidoreductase [Microbacterium oryzae]MDN3310373.1 SDR family NAD(P)-dependent oxidoreductase [Microbacterium oryzae]
MDVSGGSAIVTGGASGLGLATARELAGAGAHVVIVDLPHAPGEVAAGHIHGSFAPADVTDGPAIDRALDIAEEHGPLHAVVHCAGRISPVRLVERDGSAGSLETFEEVVRVNLVGTFNVLRLAAARMATNDPQDGERGVCVLTASVAAFEGQIGQIPYTASKAGVVGMTLVAARDLASKLIRVVTIAPGTFETPMLATLPEDVRASLAAAVPHPARLGHPEEFAALAAHIVANPMLNGETIRLDGAIRMPPR